MLNVLNNTAPKTHKQDGFDLFFYNCSNAQAKRIVLALNSLKRTMNGETMRFELTKGRKGAKTITVRYSAVATTTAELMFGLSQNRKIAEAVLKALKLKNVEFDGSEFYVALNGSSKDFSNEIKNLVN